MAVSKGSIDVQAAFETAKIKNEGSDDGKNVNLRNVPALAFSCAKVRAYFYNFNFTTETTPSSDNSIWCTYEKIQQNLSPLRRRFD